MLIHQNFPFSLLNIAGGSFSGKTTLIKTFRERYPTILGFSKSCTDRDKEAGESDDLYDFVLPELFQHRIDSGYFMEWNKLKSNGKRYGTPWSEYYRIKNEGKVMIMDVDNNGSQYLKKEQGDDIFNVFLKVSLERLYERMMTPESRFRDNADERLMYAKEETEFACANIGTVYDYILPYDFRTPSQAITMILSQMRKKALSLNLIPQGKILD